MLPERVGTTFLILSSPWVVSKIHGPFIYLFVLDENLGYEAMKSTCGTFCSPCLLQKKRSRSRVVAQIHFYIIFQKVLLSLCFPCCMGITFSQIAVPCFMGIICFYICLGSVKDMRDKMLRSIACRHLACTSFFSFFVVNPKWILITCFSCGSWLTKNTKSCNALHVMADMHYQPSPSLHKPSSRHTTLPLRVN